MASLRSQLYRSARLLGDAQAIRKGPAAVLRREGRKVAYRRTNDTLASLLRSFGLK